ncbi:site-specific DNA-methyltransferase [Blautia sp.]|mgnify:CR=1 FL=1|uniref:site-specific DNA-methyltransferase n=1 Tax=Blautia sp. TaxID=1955243 RepID=UPI002E790ABF|nr:site-specific DNA-methyltransferase [Blautia sp.]MEE0810264.1 site-specific DNA-methyltransferase [Blautia sp.]
MEKMKFETISGEEKNISLLAKIFPNCVTEGVNQNGDPVKTVNFEILRQILSAETDDSSERYEFTWPGKRKAIVEANKSIRMTLRPCIEKSRKWNVTENLYIEGENLSVLKLLQESYLGRIKMIYIDPPYNTGSDLVYMDDFAVDNDKYDFSIGLRDEDGLKLYKNTESNGRFHSDWCSMIYSRLMLARNLLSVDGVIFISIDDNEQVNLKKICDEIFGEVNCVGEIIRKTKSMTADNGSGFNLQHEVLLIYAKDKSQLVLKGEAKVYDNYSNPDNDPNGDWCSGDPSAKSGGPSTYFEIENPYTHRKDLPPLGRYWAFSKETLQRYIGEGKIKFKQNYREGERGFIFKRYKKDATSLFEPVHSLFGIENEYMNQAATVEVKKLFGNDVFSYPKPVSFIQKLVKYGTEEDSIVLDFFSGSATTAQAVMEQNAADGGKRKFIMVQLQEPVDNPKAGYETLCDIGRDRIRLSAESIDKTIDDGYRTLVLDDTNMNEVYYRPAEYSQNLLAMLESNIKSDRTDLDILFGCLLEWGLPLSLPYSSEKIEGCVVHNYNNGELLACFDENIPDSVVKAVAKQKPLRAVFRDSSFVDSTSKINVGEIFKLMAPDTKVKVI